MSLLAMTMIIAGHYRLNATIDIVETAKAGRLAEAGIALASTEILVSLLSGFGVSRDEALPSRAAFALLRRLKQQWNLTKCPGSAVNSLRHSSLTSRSIHITPELIPISQHQLCWPRSKIHNLLRRLEGQAFSSMPKS